MSQFLDGISKEYIRLYPDEAARIIEQLPAEDASELVSGLPSRECAQLLARANLSQSILWAKQLPPERLVQVAGDMANDFCALLIRRLPADLRHRTLKGLPETKSAAIARTLDYPAHSIGAVTDPVVLTIMQDSTVSDAIEDVRDSLDYQHDHLYVVSRDQKLTGIITLREFITARPEQTIKAVMKPPPLVLSAGANRNQFVEHVLAAGYEEVPVTDHKGILLGVMRKHFVLRVDDLPEPDRELEPVSLVLSLAELFWQITAGFMPGGARKGE
ncbi:MAG: CBS domain-containing protein [Ketobacteraceae bacterium]|nr:CBS domain-containing protein [Ketobacteraceae bacterium]